MTALQLSKYAIIASNPINPAVNSTKLMGIVNSYALFIRGGVVMPEIWTTDINDAIKEYLQNK